MGEGKQKIWMIVGVIFLIVATILGVYGWQQYYRATPKTEKQAQRVDTDQADESEIANDIEVTTQKEAAYVSPIDFESLWEINSDICAWFSIPGLDISAPIVCREGDDEYYLRRDSDGNTANAGSYFIEDDNSLDMSDPVTVVYGHNMRSGDMFGNLQESYSNTEFFMLYNSFTVYTPEAEYEYTIFAAVPFSNKHLLYYYNFHQFGVLRNFLEEIYATRSLIANVDESIEIEEGDRIMIFSTCLDGDNTQRYLLMGVCKQ